MSSSLYITFSILSLILNYKLGKREDNWFWPHILSIGLSCASLLVSQLYLAYCHEALFPTDDPVDPAHCRDILTAQIEPLWEVKNQTKTDSTKSIRQDMNVQSRENTNTTTREFIQMTNLSLTQAKGECNKKVNSDSSQP